MGGTPGSAILAAALGALCLGAAHSVLGQAKPPVATLAAEPRGVYASIDLRPAQEMIRRLNAASGTVRRPAIREVLKDPSVHMPPVLYALANALSGDDPEDAIFWYHVGRVRAVYDALRCRDVTARGGVTALGRDLNLELRRAQHFQRNQLPALATRAVEWDAKNPRNYDQRWVALFGNVAHASAGAETVITVPEGEWPEILKKVHETHLKSVQDFVEEKKSR
jgi:hypothetical protein